MIEVVCALIKNNDDRLLVVQRSEKMSHPLTWEFPGGKVGENESEFDAIRREIREELEVDVEPLQKLEKVIWQYPKKKIGLIPIICELRSYHIRLAEHCSYRWVRVEELGKLNLLDADRAILIQLQ